MLLHIKHCQTQTGIQTEPIKDVLASLQSVRPFYLFMHLLTDKIIQVDLIGQSDIYIVLKGAITAQVAMRK